MRPAFLVWLAMALLAPSGLAHQPPGPKTYCEEPVDRLMHDYQVGQPGRAMEGSGDSRRSVSPRADLSTLRDGGDQASGGCDGRGLPGAGDGHMEFAVGGAYLASSQGGTYDAGPWAGARWGAPACLHENADHDAQMPIVIVDAALGGAVGMDIAADVARESAAASEDPETHERTICGDHLIEPCDPTDLTAMDQTTCNANDRVLTVLPDALGTSWNVGTPNFFPGQNGAYIVFVLTDATLGTPGGPTAGHVFS